MMTGYNIPNCAYCGRCIDRHIIQAVDIMSVLSDPHNSAEERARLVELLRERDRIREEAAQVRQPMFSDDERPDLSGIRVGDCVSAKFLSCGEPVVGEVLEVIAERGWLCVKQGGGQYGGRPERVEKIVKA